MCLKLGIDDPEGWLEGASPRQLAVWNAFYRLEPWGATAERSATVAAAISALTAIVAAGSGVEMEPQSVADFMPSNWVDERRGPRRSGTDRPGGHSSERSGSSAGSVDAAEAAFAAAVPTAKNRRYD